METTPRIKNFESSVTDHNVPIIALTAETIQGDREICMDVSMNDYIPKSIQPGDLFNKFAGYIALSEKSEIITGCL